MIAFWPNIGKRKQTAIVGPFLKWEAHAEPVAPATGRSYRFSVRRQVPAYRRQATGLSAKSTS